MRDFKNILIVRTDRMGDVVLTTASIKILRQAYPNAKISIIVSPGTKDLVEGNPYLDEVLIDDRKIENAGFLGFLKLIQKLRKKKFDLAIVFHTKKRTNLICFLAGIPYRIGYKNNKFGFLLTHPIKDIRHLGIKHESEYCLDVLKHLDIETENKVELFLPTHPKSEQWLHQFFKEKNISDKDRLVVIHAGASDPSRRWPEHYYADLIRHLIEKYNSKVVLIGDKSMQSISDKILSLVSGPVFDLSGQTTMSHLVSLIRRCDLLISNDSGPVHLASGVSAPVVAIFTRNQPGINPERWRPLGPKIRVVSVPRNTEISFAKAKEMDAKYLEMIRMEEVLEAVDAIFKL